jgi:hypothetical protein
MFIRYLATSLLSFFIFSINPVLAQFDPIPSPEWVDEHKDSLRKELLNNKEIVSNFEHSILAALMYYPNLEKTHISFKTRNISTTMAALPSVWNIFRKQENRRYSILINESKNRLKAPLLKNVPFEARVGVIGHELAHIVDYNRKGILQIIGNGIGYLVSNRFKRNLEHKVDRIAINKGLGEGLYTFRLYVEEEANTTERYRRFKDNIYLSSSDIASLVESIKNLAHED